MTETMKTARKAERAAEREKFLASLKVGDILESIWGYDQTNCNFYRITRISGCRVEFVELKTRLVGNGGASTMSGAVVPTDEPAYDLIHKTNVTRGFIKFNNYRWAEKWDGKPVRVSWYA